MKAEDAELDAVTRRFWSVYDDADAAVALIRKISETVNALSEDYDRLEKELATLRAEHCNPKD